MSYWKKAALCASALVVGAVSICGVGYAATLEVGSGKPFSSIQKAVDSANSGDTIIVHDGTYRESVIVDVENLTIQSKNEWGATLDGEKNRNRAFDIEANKVKIVGFKIKNFIAVRPQGNGIIYMPGAAKYAEIKYNYFTGNTVDDYADIAIISHNGADNTIVRGNVFSGNIISGASRSAIYGRWATNVTIELNKCDDKYTPSARFLYWTNKSNNLILKNNYIRSYSRIRMQKNANVKNNIFDRGPGYVLEFHDQVGTRGTDGTYNICPNHKEWLNNGKSYSDYKSSPGGCFDDANEKHFITKNTFFRGGGTQVQIIGQDDITFTYNLFIDPAKGKAITEEPWGGNGSSPGATISNNRYDSNVLDLHDLEADEVIESGNSGCEPNYNTATGSHNCNQTTYGANLKIDNWPFTEQDGTSIASDYPYSGNKTPSQSADLEIPPSPTDLQIIN